MSRFVRAWLRYRGAVKMGWKRDDSFSLAEPRRVSTGSAVGKQGCEDEGFARSTREFHLTRK